VGAQILYNKERKLGVDEMKQTDAATNLVAAREESKGQTGAAIVRFDLIGPVGLGRYLRLGKSLSSFLE